MKIGVRRLRRDFLDVHAAGGRRHDDRAPAARSSTRPRYSSRCDREAFFHQHARHDAAFRPGLVRLERHADQVAGDALGLVGVLGQLDAAALAAAAGVNLRLDDDRAAAEALGDLGGLGRREGDLARGARGHRGARGWTWPGIRGFSRDWSDGKMMARRDRGS